ncbi:MAG: SRPBCC domain-containing protein [Rhodobacteraceae bacterium]|nr:SRPBCC domain-containing protein [Paracoccaceae bacterium]
MPDLRFERDLDISAPDLWDFITTTEGLLKWWGPEGVTVPEYDMDFTRTGPWYSVMVGGSGQRYKVSGMVTDVRPKRSVSYTWAWHDEADKRGTESRVRMSVSELGADRSRFVLEHLGLADSEAAGKHDEGWTSCLKKMESVLAPV